MNKTKLGCIVAAAAVITVITTSQPASAHVVVKPAQVGIGSFQTFTTSVPVEKEMATAGLRVVLPEGLDYVTPTVKPGWTVTVNKQGEGDAAKATEIVWTGGSIPAGQRDEFSFSAKVPAEKTTLTWKAYQTYQDGSVVSWDQTGEDEEAEDKGPASKTEVIDDLAVTKPVDNAKLYSVIALILSLIAVAFSMNTGKAK